MRSCFMMLGLTLSGVFANSALAGNEDPAARTQSLVDAFKSVRKGDDAKPLTAADRQANLTAFTALDGFFDYDRITADAIAPQKANLSADQLQRYKQMFKELIRLVAYPDSGAFLKRAQLTISPAQANGAGQIVAMDCKIPADDIETKVVFTWAKRADGLRVTDVAFDGSSLIKDYQNQFGRIIAKDKATGFIALLEKRLAKEQKERQAIP